MRFVISLASLFALLACGFHVERFDRLSDAFPTLCLRNESNSVFEQQLRQRLSGLGISIRLSGNFPDTCPTINIGRINMHDNWEVGDTTQARSYTFSFSVPLKLVRSNGQIVTQNDYTTRTQVMLNPGQIRIPSTNLQRIHRSLHAEVIERFLMDAVHALDAHNASVHNSRELPHDNQPSST